MQTIRELGHDDAWKVVEAVRRHLGSHGLGAAVAVVDTHGELIAFLRTDGCPLPSVANAMNKAFTAARERTSSQSIGQKSRADGFPITNFGDLRYTGWGGGVPLEVDGAVVGAVGVSGLSEEVDIRLAGIGAAALTEP